MVFRSAGFLMPGRRVPDQLAAVLAHYGVDASHHRSYRIDDASVRAADMVLTMEGEHVRQATTLVPSAFPKIIPIRKAASVIEQIDGETVAMARMVAAVNVDREPVDYLSRQWDVPDPYGGRMKAYRRAVDQIDELLTTVIARLL
jgi:protein-tyrosine-phosphatase